MGDDSVILRGNTRPEAIKLNDRGRLEDAFTLEHILLLLQRSPEREQALIAMIDRLHDRKSSDFHHWLTPEQIGQNYGVARSDIDMVNRWLRNHGFTVNSVYPNQLLIDFSGTAGQVREAFRTEMHELSVNGERHISNMSDPRIPAELAEVVKGVVSLNDFKPHKMARRVSRSKRRQFTYGPDCGYLTGYRDGDATSCEGIMPGDLATIYNFNPLFNVGISGKGQTIAVLENENAYSLGDWNSFRKVAGLAKAYPYGSVKQSHPALSSGSNNCADPGDANDGGDDEVAIDMEWSSAAAPNATIQIASCADTRTTFGGLIALQNLLNAPGANTTGPAIISISYGDSESQSGATQNAAFNISYQQAVAEGVSIFVSSGDQGAASSNGGTDATRGITVSGWTSTPYNISVGGTDFADAYEGTESKYWSASNTSNYGSAKSYIPEIPWNDSCASDLVIDFLGNYYSSSLINGYGASGTGVCNTYPFGGTSSAFLLTTAAGSGGPSNCAMGAPTTAGAPASGGTCVGYAKPLWQSVFGNPSDGVRDIPDVSLMAADGAWNHFYVICMSNPAEISDGSAVSCDSPVADWPGFGGTSVSSPIWAGIQALVNQKTGERWGLANTVYYSIAKSEYGTTGNPNCNSNLGADANSSCVFHDVTKGSIVLPCSTLGTGASARLYNCYRPSATGTANDYGVMSAAPQTFPGFTGPGPVTAVNVTASGGGLSSYTSPPACTLTGATGSGAVCSASLSFGIITSLTLTANGSHYTADNPPACHITGGGGRGATCIASVNSSGIITLALLGLGSGYISTPNCRLSGGSGTGATCSATSGTGVTGIALSAGGSGYTSDPTCTLTGGGGIPAATCASVINGVTDLYPQAYPAGTGWDFATGIGTVNAYNLVFSPAWLATQQ